MNVEKLELTNNERCWRLKDIGKDKWTQRNVWTLPTKWKYHLTSQLNTRRVINLVCCTNNYTVNYNKPGLAGTTGKNTLKPFSVPLTDNLINFYLFLMIQCIRRAQIKIIFNNYIPSSLKSSSRSDIFQLSRLIY